MSVSASRYWNSRLDPLDWKSAAAAGDAAWERARDTFLAPATRDGVESLGDLNGRRLLELGSGQGHGAWHLAQRGADVVGLDLSDRRCAVAAGRVPDADGRARFCAGSAEHLPFADGSFDRIFARDVLMYADPANIARECERVLAPGGRAVFVESMAGPWPLRWFRAVTSPREYRSFTRHLGWSELRGFGAPLRSSSAHPYYLLSLAAFFCLFVLKSDRLHRWLLALLHPLDAVLLRWFPGLSTLAWRATVVLDKKGSGE